MGKLKFSPRFGNAFELANNLHINQYRKGTDVLYISHLLAVTALVMEAGGDEDLAIAALLHDAVEDQGGIELLDKIKEEFGSRVAQIVKGCSDSFKIPKPPWIERKQNYLKYLKTADRDVLLVSQADKLHNARSILLDLLYHGEATWGKFKGGKEGTIWYYQSLLEIFQNRWNTPLVDEFDEILTRIKGIASGL